LLGDQAANLTPALAITFLSIPSALANSYAKRAAAMTSGKLVTTSIHGHAYASGISTSVMMPFVP
jgi:hypothetical protein